MHPWLEVRVDFNIIYHVYEKSSEDLQERWSAGFCRGNHDYF